MTFWSIRQLQEILEAQNQALARLLIECVDAGASVSFLHPLTLERAGAFWQTIHSELVQDRRMLLSAEDAQGICGSVQLVMAQPENQPHRAELVKLLVSPRVRKQGLGASLVRAAEDLARQKGKSLLVLDTVSQSDAARLYERLGWQRVGEIPNYALSPRGLLQSTTFYYRSLSTSGPEQRKRGVRETRDASRIS